MRGTPLTLVALLLSAPLVASLPAPAPLPAAAVPPPLPADLTDGDLLRLLAAHQGIALREPRLVVPLDATLEGVTLDLAGKAGTDLTPRQVAELRALDPRIAAPTLTLLLAVDQAWDLRDEAFARVPPEDMARLLALDPTSDETARIAASVDPAPLYEAAILLLDTLEGPVLPALQSAARTVPWPQTALVDNPVLRLGGAGDDAIGSDRIVQIDPSGNDLYRNNAGASTLLDPATLVQTAIGVSVDFAGNDRYDRAATVGGYRPPAQGSGLRGVGVLLDLEGDDSYSGDRFSQGIGSVGIGMLRDLVGSDTYTAGDDGAGWSSGGPGILRDDEGDDHYWVGSDSGGASSGDLGGTGAAFGLLWDRAGSDTYSTGFSQNEKYGWSAGKGDGWLVDEGNGLDVYETALNQNQYAHGCNDCTWTIGLGSPQGRGGDNAGGLAAMFSSGHPYTPMLGI